MICVYNQFPLSCIGDDFMNSGGLFEEAPIGEVSLPAPVEADGPLEKVQGTLQNDAFNIRKYFQ